MKKILIILIISIIYSSCSTNKYEKKLIGTWYDISEYEKLEFNKDSLIISDFYVQPYKWKADNSEITFSQIPVFKDSVEERKMNFKLLNNDFLILFKQIDTLKKDSLLKANSYTEFILKKNNIKIKLGDNNKSDYVPKNFHNSIKVFIGYENNSIIRKTEYSNNLENLDNDIEFHLKKINGNYEKFKEDIKQINQRDGKNLTQIDTLELYERWINSNVSFSLFADKDLPNDLIENVVKKLKRSQIKKVYQIYERIENYADADFDVMKGIER